MKLKLILFIFLLSSNGLLAQIKNEDKTNDSIEKILGNKSAQAIIDKTKQDALNNASSLAVTKTKSYLETLFPTVEVSLGLGDPAKPTGGAGQPHASHQSSGGGDRGPAHQQHPPAPPPARRRRDRCTPGDPLQAVGQLIQRPNHPWSFFLLLYVSLV